MRRMRRRRRKRRRMRGGGKKRKGKERSERLKSENHSQRFGKYINIMTFASFEGRKMLAPSLFSKFVFEDVVLHISFGFPGPLRMAFELKD